MRKTHSKLKVVLPVVAGLVLGVNAFGKPTEPKIIDNFNYASHRNVPAIDGKCYEGKIFNYNLLSNDTIAQSDKERVIIEPVWFYDIDNDGKFGKAEMDALKAGIPIFMHKAFNDIANAKVRNFLERATEYNSLCEQLKQQKELSEKERENYEIQLAQCRADISRLEKQLAGKETPEILSLTFPKPKPLPMAEPQIPGEVPKKITPVQSPAQNQKQKKDYNGVYLLAQGTFNNALDAYGATVGVRVNPFKNADIGFGANLDLGLGLDKQTDSYNDVLTSRLSTAGSVTETNKFSIGGSLEAQLGPFIIGGGLDYKNWVRQSVAQIIKDNKVTKSNTDSISNRQVFGKVYGGIEFQLGDNFKLGATTGYNWKDGLYFGVRTGIKLK